MRALQLQPGDKVLDIPCGAGRVAIHLAKAGCRVTGIDRNANFVARAQQSFADESVAGKFRPLDMRKLDDEEAFDAIYNWSGSFGYFSDAENADVLRRMAQALKSGGRLLIDQPNREWVLRNFQSTMLMEKYEIYTQWDRSTQRLESTYQALCKGHMHSTLSMRLYALSQFRHLFAQVGLTLNTAYGGKDSSPYTRTSRRLIVVGRKR